MARAEQRWARPPSTWGRRSGQAWSSRWSASLSSSASPSSSPLLPCWKSWAAWSRTLNSWWQSEALKVGRSSEQYWSVFVWIQRWKVWQLHFLRQTWRAMSQWWSIPSALGRNCRLRYQQFPFSAEGIFYQLLWLKGWCDKPIFIGSFLGKYSNEQSYSSRIILNNDMQNIKIECWMKISEALQTYT